MKKQALNLRMIQANPVTGDITGNTEMAIRYLRSRDSADADLLIFSECFVTGYPVHDLVLRPGFQASVDAAIETLRREVMLVGGPAILIGAPQASGGLPYNAAWLIEPTGAIRVVQKTELPNSDVFDERRTFAFAEGKRRLPLAFRGFNLGIQICEDVWHADVSRALADELADILVVINGSPYHRDKYLERLRVARARVKETGLPLIYVNQVGGQDELVFDGGSFTMNKDGSYAMTKAFKAGTTDIRLVRGTDGDAHIEFSDKSFEAGLFGQYPSNHTAADYEACVLALRDFMRKNGQTRAIVGVSGGLDSAIVLTMAVDAIGPRNVIGVMLPSEHTSQLSLDLADDLMNRLGVVKRTISIAAGFNEGQSALEAALDGINEEYGQDTPLNRGIAYENMQARLRGLQLMSIANAVGGMVLSTGNKSEVAVGYCTLYGDMVGGFNPLKSVYKSEAFEMARWRNACDPNSFDVGAYGPIDPIPAGIISRPPSAELADGQTDAAALGEYEILDAVLKLIIEDRQGAEGAAWAIARNFAPERIKSLTGGMAPEAYCQRIAGLVRRAQHKRVQACPGVKLNPVDFGAGWRMPIAGSYNL